MTGTTYGDISPRTAARASMEMLTHAAPTLVLAKMGKNTPQPKNATEAVKWRRYIPFTVSTVPLQEGVTPNPQLLTHEDVTATLKQYGSWVPLTDWILDTHEDPVLKETSILIGEQAAATNEQIVYNVLKAGTTVMYANGASRDAVNTAISLNLLRKIARQLYSQKAKKISRILDASPDYGTSAVEAAYVVVCHSDVVSDIRNLAGFIPAAEYGSRKLINENEVGSVEDFRFIAHPDLAPFEDAGGAKGTMKSTSGTSADVYPLIVLGQDAYGVVPLKGEYALTPIVHNPKVSDSDPLAQRGHVAYKFATTAVILNELWMCRGEVAVTAL